MKKKKRKGLSYFLWCVRTLKKFLSTNVWHINKSYSVYRYMAGKMWVVESHFIFLLLFFVVFYLSRYYPDLATILRYEDDGDKELT